MSDDSSDARLIDLETRLAYHERMVEDLSEVITEQGRTIDSLNLKVRRLSERLQDLEAGLQRMLPDSPPPHY